MKDRLPVFLSYLYKSTGRVKNLYTRNETQMTVLNQFSPFFMPRRNQQDLLSVTGTPLRPSPRNGVWCMSACHPGQRGRETHSMGIFLSDIPSTTTVPPLTPGTTQKMSQAVHESFKTFEREQLKYHISNGKLEACLHNLSFM